MKTIKDLKAGDICKGFVTYEYEYLHCHYTPITVKITDIEILDKSALKNIVIHFEVQEYSKPNDYIIAIDKVSFEYDNILDNSDFDIYVNDEEFIERFKYKYNEYKDAIDYYKDKIKEFDNFKIKLK